MSERTRNTLNRRELIQAAGSALAVLGLAAPAASLAAASRPALGAGYEAGKARVGLLFCADMRPENMREIKLIRSVITAACPRIEFTQRNVTNADQATAAVRELEEVDGFLVWSLGRNSLAMRAANTCDRPVVIAVDGPAGR